MKNKKVYLAGPMTGYENFNFSEFDKHAYTLRRMGYDVFSPADNDREHLGKPQTWMPSSQEELAELGFDLRVALGQDLDWICEHAEAIAMIPGWERSRGACAEHATAVALGIEIMYL